MKLFKKKTFAISLSLLIAFTAFLPTYTFAAQLSDISGNWAQKEIQYFVDQGIISGYTDGTFLPDRPVTRAEFIRIVNKTYKFTTPGSINFTDVKSSDWFYDDVRFAVAAGYIAGYTDNTFKPNRNISRQETAIIIQRILKAASNSYYATGVFSDVSSSSYYNGAIGAVTSVGVMKGTTSNTFSPESYETRADTAYSLYNAYFNGTNKNSVVDGNVFVREAIYGPSSDYSRETVSGNVYVKNSGNQTTLKNLDIRGDLIIEDTVSRVYAENLSVKGKLVVNGGSFLELNKTDVQNMEVNNSRETISINASKDSVCYNTNIYSSCTLSEDSDAYSRGFSNVVINGNTNNNTNYRTTVNLSGEFVAVDVYPASTTLNLQRGQIADLYFNNTAEKSTANFSSNTKVENLEVNATYVTTKGDGIVSSAKVEASNVTLQTVPGKLTGSYAPKYSYYDEYSNIEITVVNRSGAPVSGASVKLYGNTKTTDSQGIVSFVNIPAGTHEYTVDKNGFTTVSGSITATNTKTTRTVTITGQGWYTLTLNVVDNSNSAAVSSATVTLKNGETRYTSSTGAVSFSSLDSGVYQYTISNSGYQTVTDTVAINDYNEIKTVRLIPNYASYYVDFTVRNTSGTPVTGAYVVVGSKTGTTNSSGYVRISELSSGNYAVSVSATGFNAYSGSINVSQNQSEVVTLSGNTYSVAVSVRDAHTNAPIPDVFVKLGGQILSTNSNGYVQFSGLVPTSYSMEIVKLGYNEDPPRTITINNANLEFDVALIPST